MKFILINFIILLVVMTNGFSSQNNLSNDKININNKYLIYDNSTKYDGRLYVFTNYNSCSSCINNLSSLINDISYDRNLELVVFVSGISNSSLPEIKTQNDWNFEVVPDPLGVYLKEYNITKNNSYILLNNDGYLISSGDFFDIVKNPSILEVNQNSDNIRTTISLINEFAFKIDTNHIVESRYVQGLYSKKLNKYYICNPKKNSIFIFDSLGIMKNSIKIVSDILLNKPSCIDMTWIDFDEKILIHLAGENMMNRKYTNLFLEFNINTYNFKSISLTNLDTLSTPVFVYANPINQGFASVSNFRQFMKSKRLDEIKPLTLYDSNALVQLETGFVMKEYFEFEIKKAYMELVTFSNSNLFSLQAYSKVVQKIDLQGNVVDSINLIFPQSFRNIKLGLSNDPTRNDWADFIRNCSMLRDFSFDLKNNFFLTIIRNDSIPNNVEDPFSPLCKRNYYLNIFDENGKLLSDDYKLNEDFPTIIYYQDNSIGILHTTNNILRVKWYEFNKNN